MITTWDYIWIVGEKNLEEFCQRRFKDRPHFMECTGRCGSAKIHLIYKHDEANDRWRQCYLLVMERYDKKGLMYTEISDKIYFWTYDQIRADRRTIGA